jgi:hypothetical protein
MMFFSMLVGAMLARDAFPTVLKKQYGVDLTKYTAAERERLFKPMNSSRTIEPIVLITRADALDWEKHLK